MLTDCHNHILPEIDDGSKSVEMSVAMLQMMQEQGIARVIATFLLPSREKCHILSGTATAKI